MYENKNRKVDVDNLRHMMNVGNDFTSHSNFITQLKKSIKDINEFSDIYVGYKVIKKRNLKSGKSEIISIKFTISKDELKLQKQRVIDTQSIEKETIVESVETVETQTATDTVTVVPTKTFDKYIDELVESEYQRQKSYGSAHNISEVLDFIQNDMNDYYFSVEQIINDDIKFDVGRL